MVRRLRCGPPGVRGRGLRNDEDGPESYLDAVVVVPP